LFVIKYHEYLVIVLTSNVPVLRRELTEIKVALFSGVFKQWC